LYDVDPLTLSPDLSSFDRVLAAGASVGVIAPLYGIPVDWEALADLGRRYGVPLVEDASQGHGAFRENAMIGALGSLSTLSFGRGKGWTGGAGGAVLMRGSRSFESSSLSSLGRLAEIRGVAGLLAQWALGRPAVYGVPRSIPLLALGETRYHAPIPPTPMTAGAAAAVLCNESASLKEASLRRDNAACLLAAVRGTGLTAIEVPAGWTAGYMRLPLLVPASADGLPSAAIELGAARSYPTPLSTLPALTRQLVVGEKAWPGAVRLARELITLPTHSRLTVAERRRLLEVIKRWTVSGGLSVRLHA
jgi:dTDP-4-amino-4,6-dideoxygalactose transaminase